MYEVEAYTDKRNRCPIEEYIRDLNTKAVNNKKERAILKKILEYIKILERYGTRAGLPYMKYIDAGIWELRPSNNRILFVHYKDGKFLLLHFFRKSTNKTPAREIIKAKNNLQDYLTRSRENEQEVGRY
jgi:phage-related protein